MQKITLLFTFLITLALSMVIVVFFDNERTQTNTTPRELYQVYLNGEKIGVIESKEKLEAYIDEQQKKIKEQYNVKKVYPPKNLSIQKYVSYNANVLSEKEVYELIKEKDPFTIKGWTFKIKKEGKEDIVINVIDYDMFKDAATKTSEIFISEEEVNAYQNDTQAEIKDTGKIIENLYTPDGQITEQKTYISTNEKIFIDENELARYLMFGTLDESDKYTVKDGDTIEQIAFDHKLGTDEFLIVNPQFSNANSLLVPGQEVSVGLINPLFDTVVEEHVVSDQETPYDTDTIYDNTISVGVTKVQQEGAKGIERVTQKLQITNGVITDAQIIRSATKVIKESVKRIIVKGSKRTDGTIVVSPDGKWIWPTNTPYIITTYYGYRWGSLHEAIDITGTGYGSPIYAARDGVVVESDYNKTRGNYLVLQHDNNYYTIYLHLSKKYVSTGQTVKAGQVIAAMGNTGYVVGTTGTHLHFGVYIGYPWKSDSKSVNPLKLYN